MSTSSTLSSNQLWEQFTVVESDLDHLVSFLVEKEAPNTLGILAYELASHRYDQMTSIAEDKLSQGRIYRPGEAYQVGETVVFPHLDNLTGEVVGVRAGHNPEYDPFSVIRVKTDDGTEREFATELAQPHPLNDVSYLRDDDTSADSLYETYGESIRAALQRALGMSPQFVTVGEKWFERDLLVDVSPGQINIAEAALDMVGGGPVATPELMAEIDLPEEISEPLRLFSLEYALLQDSRFDEVGPAGQVVWYLRDMEPAEVRETPPLLRCEPMPYNRQVLDDVMLSLETQAADEWSELNEPPSAALVQPSDEPVTVVLNYPHWRSGTLPLASHVANFFPTARIANRIRFTFVDDATGEEFPGWVVRRGRYVCGLKDWYAARNTIVGSFIDLSRGDQPGQIRIALRSIRSRRREWLRTVTSEGDNLLFEVTRVPVSSEFDDLAAVAVDNPEEIDALRQRFERVSLESLLDRAFGGLAGLSLQRAVHAMTLYSVLNLIRRLPPGPILATLALSPKYVSLGDNYWAYRGEE